MNTKLKENANYICFEPDMVARSKSKKVYTKRTGKTGEYERNQSKCGSRQGKNKNIYKCPYTITLDSLHLPRSQTSRKGLVPFKSCISKRQESYLHSLYILIA